MDHDAIQLKMTRRTFLKASAATAAVVAVGDTLLGGRSSLVSDAKAAAPKEDAWYPGVCKMCMQGDCLQRVHVIDGVVVKVEGDPRNPITEGTLCPRGNSSIMQLYNAWRIKAPLKRTNPKKGLNEDPQFVEISWDEAIKTVGDRLAKIKADDPRKTVVVSGFGARISHLGQFEAALGTPNDTPSRGSACAYHFAGNYVHNESPDTTADIRRVNYFINVARTLGPNIATSSIGTRHMLDAIARGAKIINIDPRCGPEASKEAEWLPIRPGTEQAFFLAMLNTMLYEIGYQKLDMWFVKNRTNGPYLIGPDGEYVRDTASNKPFMWDAKANQPVTFDTPTPMDVAIEGTYQVNGVTATPALQLIKDAVKQYTPEWSEGITTIPAAKVQEIANDFVNNAQIGSTIVIDGVTMPFRPVSINIERGAYQHTIEGVFGDLVAKIVQELVGCIEVPGGTHGNSGPSANNLGPDDDGVVKPKGECAGNPWSWPPQRADSWQFYPVSHTVVQLLAKTILDPKMYGMSYEPEVLISCGGGPVRSSFDRKVFEQAWSKVPFHVSFSQTFDENAVLADIVLADNSFLEKDQYQAGQNPHKVFAEETRTWTPFYFRDASKITPPYNARTVDAVLLDLAEAAGVLTGKDGMVDRINTQYALKGPLALDVNKKPTLRQIAEAYMKVTYGAQYSLDKYNDASGPLYLYRLRGAKLYNYSYWPDNKTRHPMYMIQLLRIGKQHRKNLEAAGLTGIPGWVDQNDYWKAFVPIPVWTPCPELNPPPEYDMWAINWKTPMAPFYCGDTYGNVWLHETMSTFDPYEYVIWMNSATATKKGINDGDTIVVESRYGKTQGKVKVTELIHPDVVGLPAGHGAASPLANPIVAEGAYFNALCSIHEKDRAIDPITGGIEEGPAVKVYKA